MISSMTPKRRCNAQLNALCYKPLQTSQGNSLAIIAHPGSTNFVSTASYRFRLSVNHQNVKIKEGISGKRSGENRLRVFAWTEKDFDSRQRTHKLDCCACAKIRRRTGIWNTPVSDSHSVECKTTVLRLSLAVLAVNCCLTCDQRLRKLQNKMQQNS
jgi:hypothetical protein